MGMPLNRWLEAERPELIAAQTRGYSVMGHVLDHVARRIVHAVVVDVTGREPVDVLVEQTPEHCRLRQERRESPRIAALEAAEQIERRLAEAQLPDEVVAETSPVLRLTVEGRKFTGLVVTVSDRDGERASRIVLVSLEDE